MKRDTILLCLAIVLGCVAFVRAQSPRQGQAPRTQQQTAAAMTAFTGCVERGATPTEFVLTVTEVPSSAGAAGTAGTSTIGQRIHLAGEPKVGAHTGHKVRITGIVVPQGTPPARGGRPHTRCA